MKDMFKILSIGSVLTALPIMMAQAETQPKFNIQPITTTTVNVLANGVGSVQYRVTNNTGVARSLTMSPLPGITINSVSTGTCGNPFILQPGKWCVLDLKITGSQVPAAGVHRGPVICKAKAANVIDPYLCSQPSQTKLLNVAKISNTLPPFAYVSMSGNQIDRCPILANGQITTSCTSYPIAGASGLDGLTLNSNKNRLYVVNFSQNNLYNCTITSSGAIGSCILTPAAGDPLIVDPTAIVLNNTNSFAYILNFTDNTNVARCVINPTNGNLSNCIPALSGYAGDKEDLALNPAGTIAYVGLGSGTAGAVLACRVAPGNGTFSNCINAIAPGTIAQPYAIAVNKTNTAAYIGNQANGILSVCYINPTNGTFTECIDAGAPSAAPVWPQEITFNQANSLLYYLNRDTDQAYRCIINPITSRVQFCVPTVVPGSGFNSAGLAVTN